MTDRGGESDDHFESMPHLQRMISRQERLFDNSCSFSPTSTHSVRLVQLSPRELHQTAKVGPVSRAQQRNKPQATTTRRVFICKRNNASRKLTGSRNASELDHSVDFGATSIELRNKGEALSPGILGGKAENGHGNSKAIIQMPRAHTVLVMLLDLSAVQDAAFQQMQSLTNKNGLMRTNSGVIEFKHLGEFGTISQFRRWFSRENAGTQIWRLICRQCFALKPIEVHAYMCNRSKGCPCLLAVRYSMLFDEIGVFQAREHIHEEKQRDEDDDIEVIWPRHIEKNQALNATTSDGCKSSSVLTNAPSLHQTSVREPLCEVANTETDWAEDTFHSSTSTDCEPSNCSSSSSHMGPAEDLLSKVLQEADIPVEFGLDIGGSSKIVHDIHEGCILKDNQGVIAQEEVVSSNILVRRSIVMRDNKMKSLHLVGQRMHEMNASRSQFTIAGGAFSRCFENGRSTSLSTIASENDRDGRECCTWKIVSRGPGTSLARGTIKVRRVESIRAISDANVFGDGGRANTIRSGEGCVVSPPVYTLGAEQLEALRPKCSGESSRLEITRDFERAVEQQAIMADELMDCSDSEPFTTDSSMEQATIQKAVGNDEERHVRDENMGSSQQPMNVQDGTGATLLSSHLPSHLQSDRLNIKILTEKLSQYMESCLTTRMQKLCSKRVLEIVDTALAYKKAAVGHSCMEA
uniref:Uncharacterized protein n=1 Tax=Parascaris univalens TaxID=6257 RepID=A0A915AKC2_PARUN